MVTVEELSRLVSGVYAAATGPQDWAAALADISRVLDASGCGLPTGEGTSRAVMIATVPREAHKVYTEYYCTIDYVLDAVEQGPAGLIRGGQALVALKTNSEFEADFMRPFEMNDGMFVRLAVGPTPTSFLVCRAERARTVRYARAGEVDDRVGSTLAAGPAYAGQTSGIGRQHR
jgi:hypothetical protein